MLPAPRGFVAAQRGGYLSGLFSLEICPSPGGPVLLIDHVFVLSPVAPRDLAAAMHDYVQALVQCYGCHTCMVSLPAASSETEQTGRLKNG